MVEKHSITKPIWVICRRVKVKKRKDNGGGASPHQRRDDIQSGCAVHDS